MNLTTWRSELIDEIRTISDLSTLEDLWLGRNPSQISSYSEEVAHIFGELDIDGFLELSADSVLLSEPQRAALMRFRNALSDFVDAIKSRQQKVSDIGILKDPRFVRVSDLAAEFIRAVDQAEP